MAKAFDNFKLWFPIGIRLAYLCGGKLGVPHVEGDLGMGGHKVAIQHFQPPSKVFTIYFIASWGWNDG
jgi:hypothetical protein